MAQRSTEIRIRLPAHEELARYVAGMNEYIIERLPELWKHLNREERAEIKDLIQQLRQVMSQLNAVTQEARRQVQIERNQGAIELLRSWKDADEDEIAEQQETWEYLRKALDEDRLSNRPLFP